MEIQPGWGWTEYQGKLPMEYSCKEISDINNDGHTDVFVYGDARYEDELIDPSPNTGGVFSFNGLTGAKLWETMTNNPVKAVFPVLDINGDGLDDYLISIGSSNGTWNNNEPFLDYVNFANRIISIKNGSFLTTDSFFTQNAIISSVCFEDSSDPIGIMYCLEAINATLDVDFGLNITSYSLNNGSKIDDLYTNDRIWDTWEIYETNRAIEKFNWNNEEHMLFFGNTYFTLLNQSNLDLSNPIYNYTYNLPGDSGSQTLESYDIIEDLTGDNTHEIVLVTRYNHVNPIFNISWFNGLSGELLGSFNHSSLENPGENWMNLRLDEILNEDGDTETYILITNEYRFNHKETVDSFVYSIDESSYQSLYTKQSISENDLPRIFSLEEDMNDDGVSELVTLELVYPILSSSAIRRFKIISFLTNEVFAIMNFESGMNTYTSIQDIDGNGKRDMLISEWMSIKVLSTSDPSGLWFSPEFPIGFYIFLFLGVLLILGVILLIAYGKKLAVKRDRIKSFIKRRKLATYVNISVIALMTISFLLFLLQINITNRTLMSGESMTEIIIIYLVVTIIWYGSLPLTAAIFNQFAPKFAFLFIKLRNLFFKLSKKRYYNEILIVDMGERKEISSIIKLKRVILPMLLSIAIGFYVYNNLAPILGYSQSFESFNSADFNSFIVGYNLLCMLPMIISFIIFSFFISGNYLLDDAGVVYFRQMKKYRQPGDIEPISIWAQSIVKGMAGVSALFTFFTFFISVDFSGFFDMTQGISFAIFGFFMVLIMFWGAPFLTAFSYILLAQEIMEFSVEENSEVLYEIMEENGYDTKPKELIKLYPNGLPNEEERS
ncbi:MAG: hypothetical protein GF316_12910 [Candidatus Lokiarchaeota archaeon]|nr:hypothetical protein [Candidatus Lokiarchaeota archaeon]